MLILFSATFPSLTHELHLHYVVSGKVVNTPTVITKKFILPAAIIYFWRSCRADKLLAVTGANKPFQYSQAYLAGDRKRWNERWVHPLA